MTEKTGREIALDILQKAEAERAADPAATHLARDGETEYAVICRNRSGQDSQRIDYRIAVGRIDSLPPGEQAEAVRVAQQMVAAMQREFPSISPEEKTDAEPRYYRRELTDICGNVAIYHRDRIHVEIAVASPCYADLIVAALNAPSRADLIECQVIAEHESELLAAELADARNEIARLTAQVAADKRAVEAWEAVRTHSMYFHTFGMPTQWAADCYYLRAGEAKEGIKYDDPIDAVLALKEKLASKETT
jgi:hypothetical protein